MQNPYSRRKRLVHQYWPSVMVLTLFFIAVIVIAILPLPGALKWLFIALAVALSLCRN